MNWEHPGYFAGFAALAGVATAALAHRRGRAAAPWFVFGVVAWFIAIPWLFLTKSRLPEGQAAPRGMIILAVVAICVGAVLVRSEFDARQAALPPNCDTYLGVRDLQGFVAASPAGKMSGLQLVKLTDIKEVSRSPSELACNGTAHMNTAAKVPMDYRFQIKDGKRSVEAEW
jgi:hypothetical protein